MKDGGKVALGIAGVGLGLLGIWGLTKLVKPAPLAAIEFGPVSWDS